jgi:hypothetical protein
LAAQILSQTVAAILCVSLPPWHGMACPQVVDEEYGLQMWRVAVNILNK